MSKPFIFLIQVKQTSQVCRSNFSNADNRDEDGCLGEKADAKDIFDSLFMIKPNMSPAEKETARANLDMIHDKLNQRRADTRARAVDWPTIDGDARPGKRKLDRSYNETHM